MFSKSRNKVHLLFRVELRIGNTGNEQLQLATQGVSFFCFLTSLVFFQWFNNGWLEIQYHQHHFVFSYWESFCLVSETKIWPKILSSEDLRVLRTKIVSLLSLKLSIIVAAQFCITEVVSSKMTMKYNCELYHSGSKILIFFTPFLTFRLTCFKNFSLIVYTDNILFLVEDFLLFLYPIEMSKHCYFKNKINQNYFAI